MNSQHTQLHPLAADYLRRLEQAAVALAPDRRAELIDGIREHLDAALAGSADADEHQVREVLDRLGSPEEIVAAAHGDVADTEGLREPVRSGPGALEIIAVILLPIGGIVLPVLGWFIGLALLWASGRWTLRDKLIGTFVWPGGYLGPLLLLLTPAEMCGGGTLGVLAEGGTDATGAAQPDTCTGGTLPVWIGAPLSIIMFAAPLAVVAYLLTRARRSS